jgi:leucine-rich PPR motif-containing protein
LIINIAQLQMANGKFTDAVATLKDYAAKHGDQLHDGGFADGYQLSELGAKLIESCCKHCELPQALELVNILFDAGYVKAGTYSILDELVDGYVKKGDSDSVVSALENCVTRYNKAPNFSEVFRYLIAKEDAERLQKVVDLVTTIHGEMNILLRLAACFVECGKVKQARRILETPGLRALMRPLIDSCERFIGLDMEKELEQFVDITKNLFAVDRSEMLLQLMRLHAKRKDTQKMMEVFSLFEEEGILPKPHILRYVAKVLESAGQPVPFEVPPPPLQRESRQKQPTGPTAKADKPKEGVAEPKQLWKDEELQQVIESGDVSKLLEMKNRQLATDSVGFSSSVVKELCRRHELQVLRKFLNGLTEAGDIESLMAAKELNLPRSLAVYIHQCLFRANIHRNKTEEILDYLKTNVTDIPKYLSSGAFFLLAAKQPDLCSRVEGLAMDCIEQTNSPVVGSYLYNYYILSGQFDKVKQLLQKSGTC